MTRILMALALCGWLIAPAMADTTAKPGLQIPLSRGLPKSAGMLDMSRLSFQHTLGVTYGSGQFGGLNQYYLNDITYKVSDPIVIKAQIGIQNNLSGMPLYGAPNSGQTQVVVPYVGILYQPKPNLRIEFSFSNMPSYYGRSHFGGYAP